MPLTTIISAEPLCQATAPELTAICFAGFQAFFLWVSTALPEKPTDELAYLSRAVVAARTGRCRHAVQPARHHPGRHCHHGAMSNPFRCVDMGLAGLPEHCQPVLAVARSTAAATLLRRIGATDRPAGAAY